MVYLGHGPTEKNLYPAESMRVPLTSTLLATCIGCFSTSSGPMTDEQIAIIANTNIQSASITFPDNTEIAIPPDNYELFRSLLRTLAPIKSTESGNKLRALANYHLQLYAAGNVATIACSGVAMDNVF